MFFKTGVNIKGVQAQTWYGIGVADQLHRQMFDKDAVITSLNDGDHMIGSRHYSGFAADIRVKDVPLDGAVHYYQVLKALLDKMGFDVVDEISSKAHVHLEWDWKPGDKDFFTGVT